MTTETFKTTKSEEIFAAAQKIMPGGVSSPVRAFKSVGGQPIVFDRDDRVGCCPLIHFFDVSSLAAF